MKNLLQFPCELINYRTYTTKRNVQIQFELQENLQPEHIAQLLASKGMTGWMVFSPTEQQVRPEDIPEAPVEPKNGKTPSQRLYNTLFVLFKSLQDEGRIEQGVNFNHWREDYMEKIIDMVKAKLPSRK